MNTEDTQSREWLTTHVAVLKKVTRAFAEPADQPDLMQELLLAVWKAAPAFRGDSAPSTFVYKIALNRALTWRKRENTRRHRDIKASAQWVIATTDGSQESDVMMLEHLYAAIRQLPAFDRALVLLSLEGLPYRDIARLHGLSESNTGARLTRIRQKLSSIIEADRHES
jgi:RNA polymerase sigma-70 factor (ECF subfamily)